MAIAPDGRSALSGSFDSLRLWDLTSGGTIRTLGNAAPLVMSVAISPDGRTALVSHLDDTIRLWDLTNGKQIRTLFWKVEPLSSDVEPNETKRKLSQALINAARSVAFMPDGRTALSGDKKLRQWDLASGSEIRTDYFANSVEVNAVAIAREAAPRSRAA